MVLQKKIIRGTGSESYGDDRDQQQQPRTVPVLLGSVRPQRAERRCLNLVQTTKLLFGYRGAGYLKNGRLRPTRRRPVPERGSPLEVWCEEPPKAALRDREIALRADDTFADGQLAVALAYRRSHGALRAVVAGGVRRSVLLAAGLGDAVVLLVASVVVGELRGWSKVAVGRRVGLGGRRRCRRVKARRIRVDAH